MAKKIDNEAIADQASFKLRDRVKWSKSPGVWVVETIRDHEPRYYIEQNSDFLTRKWARSDELEKA